MNYGRVKLISASIGRTGSFLSYKALQFLFLFFKEQTDPPRFVISRNVHPSNTNRTDRALALLLGGALRRSPLSFLAGLRLIREAAPLATMWPC